MSKYKPKSVQLLQGRDDSPHPIHLQSKYQTSYNRVLYGTWSSSMPVPNVETKLYFCGNSYIISKSKINVANVGLLIISRVCFTPKQSVEHMPIFSPLYSRSDYLDIVKYKHNMSMHSMCMNGYNSRNFKRKNLLYIDSHSKYIILYKFYYLHAFIDIFLLIPNIYKTIYKNVIISYYFNIFHVTCIII
jgi:hypothetical protein